MNVTEAAGELSDISRELTNLAAELDALRNPELRPVVTVPQVKGGCDYTSLPDAFVRDLLIRGYVEEITRLKNRVREIGGLLCTPVDAGKVVYVPLVDESTEVPANGG